MRDALALGATVCWAATTDPDYAVYCVMMARLFLARRTVRMTTDAGEIALPALARRAHRLRRRFAASLLLGGGWQITILGRHLSAHRLYTPMLLLTVLLLLRVAWPYRHAALSIDRTELMRCARGASVAAIVSAVMLSPVLYAVGVRIHENGFESSSIFWRSSPPGVDCCRFFCPTRTHPHAAAGARGLTRARTLPRERRVAALCRACRHRCRVPHRMAADALLDRADRHVCSSRARPVRPCRRDQHRCPGPWAIARYLPLVRLARTPARLPWL